MLEAITLKCLSKVSAGTSADHGAGDVDGILLHDYHVASFHNKHSCISCAAGPVSGAVIGRLLGIPLHQFPGELGAKALIYLLRSK